jgi:hypothetical protein
MKKILVSGLLAVSFIVNTCWADCDWSTGITKLPDGGYRYTEACHLKVGQMVQDIGVKNQQIQDYTKAIQLKDLAIKDADARTQLWLDTATKLTDKANKIEQLEKTNTWIYFGLGALTVFASGLMVSKLIGH